MAENRALLIRRVQEAAYDLFQLTDGGTNAPLHEYVSTQDIAALCDALTLDVESWDASDLERILLLRDGLYAMRHSLRDRGDDAEHSVERVLNAMDRLYADLERAFREIRTEELTAAQEKLAALRRGAHVQSSSVAPTIQAIAKESVEVLATTHSTIRSFELNIIKTGDINLNVELFKNARLQIKRFSASVFAIKLYLEQEVIFEGVFKFLTEGADRVISELKEALGKLKSTYKKASQFIEELGSLVEKGSRFVRLIGSFIERVFDDAFQRGGVEVNFRLITSLKGPAVTSAVISGGNILIGGKEGEIQTVDQSSYRIIADRVVSTGATINAIVPHQDFLLLGTTEGLEVASAKERGRMNFTAPYQENVTAVVRTRDGIFTGSRDGVFREWSLAGGLTQLGNRKIGRSIQRLLPKDEFIVAAAGEDIHLLRPNLGGPAPTNLGFRINDIAQFRGASIIACGQGKIVQVNLDRGIYQRFITASAAENYTCLAAINDSIFIVGAESGNVVAVDFDSGVELGRLNVGISLRGLLQMQNGRILVFGGPRNGPARNLGFLTMEIKPERVLEEVSSTK